MTIDHRTQNDIELIKSLTTQALADISRLEEAWRRCWRSTRQQRCLESAKDRLATAVLCADELIARLAPMETSETPRLLLGHLERK